MLTKLKKNINTEGGMGGHKLLPSGFYLNRKNRIIKSTHAIAPMYLFFFSVSCAYFYFFLILCKCCTEREYYLIKIKSIIKQKKAIIINLLFNPEDLNTNKYFHLSIDNLIKTHLQYIVN